MINRKIVFKTIEDFQHEEVDMNFGNNAEERKRKPKAIELLRLAKEFNVQGFIFDLEHIDE